MKQLILIIVAISSIFVGCKKNDNLKPKKKGDLTSQINAFPKEPLNTDELASLNIMREEDYLAYDVYTTLYNKWGVPVFSNIASSEQSHTNAVSTLLSKYELADPAGNHTLGVFKDTTLQALYIQLVTQGSSSVLNAFIVGATIEDLDIYDLNNWSSKADNQDILFVFQNLTKGSRNHMRAFYSQIISSGGSYASQFLSQAELDAIINSPKETGPF
jgi:hypothetical protein